MKIGNSIPFGSSRDEAPDPRVVAALAEGDRRHPHRRGQTKSSWPMSTGMAESDGFKTLKSIPDIKPAETACVLTPGNGWHIYYKSPGSLKSGSLGEAIDFLAEGKMAIAPLSVRDGKAYAYVNGHDLSDLKPLPGSILALLKRSAGRESSIHGRRRSRRRRGRPASGRARRLLFARPRCCRRQAG